MYAPDWSSLKIELFWSSTSVSHYHTPLPLLNTCCIRHHIKPNKYIEQSQDCIILMCSRSLDLFLGIYRYPFCKNLLEFTILTSQELLFIV